MQQQHTWMGSSQWTSAVRQPAKRWRGPRTSTAVARVAVTSAMLITLLLTAVSGPMAPTAFAASALGPGPAKLLKSKMHTKFAGTALTGTDCSASSPPPVGITAGPKIYNCYVRGVTTSTATIMWESDVQATATLCFNTTAYADWQCTAAGVNSFCQPNSTPNPGTSITNSQITSQQIPSGNWLYTANIAVNQSATYHYQISLQSSSTVMTSSADETFATPGGSPAFVDSFNGAGEASSAYVTENWPGGTGAGGGSVLFQDNFNSGNTLSSSWRNQGGTWAVDAHAGVATTSTLGQVDETPAILGATAGTGELTTSITLPKVSSSYPYDNAGVVIFQDSGDYGNMVWLALDTEGPCNGGIACHNGEFPSGLWVWVDDPTYGPYFKQFGYTANPIFTPGTTYYLDIRVNGIQVAAFDRTSTSAPWALLAAGTLNGSVVLYTPADGYTFTQGQSGMWNNAPSAAHSPVQFGAFTMYDTPTRVSSPGVVPGPNTPYVEALYSPNSTASLGQIVLGTSIGVQATTDNGEVDFSSDILTGLIVRAGQLVPGVGVGGDTFSITLTSGAIQGSINGTSNNPTLGSVGTVSGTAPWQLKARFDGPTLALYGQSAGTTTWQLLAAGTDNTYTSGTYVYLTPLSSALPSLTGAFSLHEETSAALTHWRGGLSQTSPAMATTSTDPNTPGALEMVNNGGYDLAYTQDQLVGDGLLIASYSFTTTNGASIDFRMLDGNNYYFFSPFPTRIWTLGGYVTVGPGINRTQNSPNVFTTNIANLPNSCTASFAVNQTYTIYIQTQDKHLCWSVGIGGVTAGTQAGTYNYPAPLFGACGDDYDPDQNLVPYWTSPGYVGFGVYQSTAILSFIQWDATSPLNIPWASFDGTCSSNPNSSGCGDPIDTSTGTFNEPDTDLALPGRGVPLTWSRNYSSSAAAQGITGPMGAGWFYNYQRTFSVNADNSVTIRAADGAKFTYAYDSADGSYTTPAGNFDHLVKNADGSYSLTTRARMVSTFQVVNAGGPVVLTKQTDADGNTTTLTYNSANQLVHVTDPGGRQLTVSYNSQGQITTVGDGTRQVSYTYDGNGNLSTVKDVDGFVTTYGYDSALNPHLLTKRYDPNNDPSTNPSPKYLLNQYAADPIQASGSGGYHVIQQTDPQGIVTQFNYNTPSTGQLQVILDPGSSPHLNETTIYQLGMMNGGVDVTNAVGIVTRYTYNTDGQPLSSIADYNDYASSGHFNATYQRIYDPRGNQLEVIDPTGFAIAYSYDDNAADASYNQVTQMVIDPVPPAGGTHLNATYTTAYYPQSAPAGFTGNPGDVATITDALGNITRLGYNAAGQVTLVEDADNHYTTYGYDAYGMNNQTIVDPTSLDPGGLNLTSAAQYDNLGRLQSTTDPDLHTTAYTYDNLLRLTQVVTDQGGLNLTVSYRYDAAGRRTSVTVDPTPNGGTTCSTAYGASYATGCHMNETTSYAYDADNRLMKVTSPIDGQQVTYPGASSPTTLSGVTSYSYDAASNLIQTTDPNGNVTQMSYDAANRLTQKTNALDGKSVTYPDRNTHPINGKIAYTYDALGRLIQTTDERGLVVKYTYDAWQHLTSVTTDPTGLNLTLTRSYDSAGRLSAATDERGYATSYAYDFDGRLATTQLPAGEQTTTQYDGVGNMTQQIVDPLPQGQTTGHLNLVTQYSYDAANRLVSQTADPNPQGGSGHLNLTTSFQYDPAGLLLQVTDPNTHTTAYTYDHAGRELSVMDAHAVATSGSAWQYAYDGAGNLRTQTDPLGHVTATQYDVLNQPIQQIIDPNPSGGSGHLALTRSQYYDSDGNAVYTTNANGQTTAMTYDALNRLTKVTYGNADTPDVALYYDDAGNRAYMTDGTGLSGTAWIYGYDLSGRPLSVEDPAGHTVDYTYDANGYKGLLTGLTYPSGHALSLGYDLDNRLTTLSSPNNALFGSGTSPSTTSFQYTYDAASRPTAVSYPNGVHLAYGYDAASRVTAINATQGTTTLGSWGYTLDGVGNPTLITDSTVGGTGRMAYGYDEANRVTSAAYWDGTSTTYSYDAAGNRASTTVGTTTTPYSYDAAGRLTSVGSTTYGYDNDGNRTSMTAGGATTTYGYDQADRLLSIGGAATTPATYSYNGDGLRVTKTASSVTTNYQWDPLSQTLLSDGTNEYVPSGTASLLVQTPLSGGASAAQYGVADLLGSTRLLTNASAQIQGTLAYDAFGVPKAPSGGSGTATTTLGFAGQLTDAESGFQDLRARLYDPSTGQFLQQDRYAGSASNPLSLNRYTYAANDPTQLVDPTGHNPVTTGLDYIQAAACAVGGPALANNILIIRYLASFAIGFYPGIGDAYFLASAWYGQDLFTGTTLSQHDRQLYAGMAAFSLATAVVGTGLFTQEALAAEHTVTELGALERLGTEAAHGAEDEARVGEAVAQEGRAAEQVASETDGASAATRDLSGLSGEADIAPSASGACSFSADTQVATPHGERPIATLKVGDIVEAYNPQTGKSEAEPVQHVWLNHDHDLVDVRLTAGGTSTAAPTGTMSATRVVHTSGHGVLIGDDLNSAVHLRPARTTNPSGETIHTTANHPWLTADRGWVEAGQLQVGEPLVTLNGSTGTVAWVHTVAGQADMYNLTVANDHTYAVGDDQAVVHNEGVGPCGSGPHSVDDLAQMVNEKQATLFGGCAGICQIRSGDQEILSDLVVGSNRGGPIVGMKWHAEEMLAPWAEANIGNIHLPAEGGTITVNFIDFYQPCLDICRPQIGGWEDAIRAAAPQGADVEIHWIKTSGGTKEWFPPFGQ